MDAAQASPGSVTTGIISVPGSPIEQVALNAAGKSQLISSTLGAAYYRQTEKTGAANTGVFVSTPGATATSTYATASTQKFGGAGSAADPYWISTTMNTATGVPATVTKKDSYVPGANYVRSDLTVTLKDGQPRTDLQLASWVDCFLGGSDSGKSAIDGPISSCIATTGATISFIAVSPGAQLAAGHYSGVQKMAQNYSDFPAGCPTKDLAFSQGTCDTSIDNGLTIAWKANLAGGESVSRTYYSSYDKDMKFSDLAVNASVSKTTVEQGDTVDYSVNVTNNGPNATPSTSVVFKLPAGMTYVSSSGGSYDSATGGWTVGPMANGESKILTIKATAAKLGAWTSQVTNATSDYIDLTTCSDTSLDNCGDPQTVTVTQVLNIAKSTTASSPSTVAADGTQYTTITVTARDNFGEPMQVGGQDVQFSTSLGELGTVVDNGDGTYSVTLVSTEAGEATVSFTINGKPADENTTSVTFLTGPPVASTSDLTVTSGNRIANNADQHRVEVTLRDANGNLVRDAGDMIVLSAAADPTAVFGTPVETSPGVYSVTVTSTTAVPTVITAAVYGSSDEMPGSGASVAYVAGPVDATYSTLTLPSGAGVAGVDTHTATVYLADAFNNPVSGVEAQFSSVATLSAPTAVTDGTGHATVTISSVKAGDWSVSATAAGIDLAHSGDTVTFAPGAPFFGAGGTAIAGTPGSVLADNAAEHQLSVKVLDAFGNAIPNTTVVFGVEAPAHLTGAAAVRTGEDGVATVGVASATSGSFEVTATVNGTAITLGTPAAVSFAAGVAVAEKSILTITGGDRVADGVDTHTATIQLRDANGNPVSGDAASILLTAVNGSIGSVKETSTPGTYTAPVSSTSASGIQVTARLGANELGTGSPSVITFVPGIASAATSLITVSPALIEANGSQASVISLTLRDAFGNELRHGGDTVVVTSTMGTAATAVDNGDGTYSIRLTSVSAGEASASFTVNGSDSPKTVSIQLVATPTAPVLFPTNGATVTGTAQPGNTVTVYNENGDSIGSVVANSDGSFSITTTQPVRHDEALTVNSTDAHGFVSPVSPTTVDSIAPDAPLVRPSNGTVVRGTAEANSLVTVYAADSSVLATVRADSTGAYSVPFSPALADLDVVRITATDAAGNESASISSTIDGSVVMAPVVTPTDGTVIAGTGAPGNTVTVTLPGGVVVTVTVAADGTWSTTPAAGSLAHGDEVTAVQTNAAGTSSDPGTVQVDQRAPAAPALDPTDGQVASGSAEPGSTVNIVDAAGTVIGTGVADSAGRFAITLAPVQQEGAWIGATATDPSGNTSQDDTLRVGLIKVIMASDSVEAGTETTAYGFNFQPGETVVGTLHSRPYPLGDATANANGEVTFKFTVPANIEPGAHTVNLVGNFSGSGSATFHIYAPAVRTSNASSGLALTGSQMLLPLAAGLVLMASGAVFMTVRRRHKKGAEHIV